MSAKVVIVTGGSRGIGAAMVRKLKEAGYRVAYFAKYALPHLPDGSGRIVNVGSVLSLRGVPDQVAYSAAKHGVLGLTRALAHLAAPRRITVNCLCPGWTRTEMAEGRMDELGLSAEQIAASVPIGRIVEPDEVASLALYLLSDAAAAITGQALLVDGGSLA
jgi:NAD(P)-dependent dehydrogenase (short-subunit alcohol dehydrogenase family)